MIPWPRVGEGDRASLAATLSYHHILRKFLSDSEAREWLPRSAFAGEGPGPQSLDGCSVELFRRIPATGEPEIVASVVPAGSRILELGSGPGRVTHPLIALGYEVTAVDNSSEMLSHIKGATTILSDIETLALEQPVRCRLVGKPAHKLSGQEHAGRPAGVLQQTCEAWRGSPHRTT